jgi:hypothetical protein
LSARKRNTSCPASQLVAGLVDRIPGLGLVEVLAGFDAETAAMLAADAPASGSAGLT